MVAHGVPSLSGPDRRRGLPSVLGSSYASAPGQSFLIPESLPVATLGSLLASRLRRVGWIFPALWSLGAV